MRGVGTPHTRAATSSTRPFGSSWHPPGSRSLGYEAGHGLSEASGDAPRLAIRRLSFAAIEQFESDQRLGVRAMTSEILAAIARRERGKSQDIADLETCPSPKSRPPRLANVRAVLTGGKKLRTRREAKIVGILWPSTLP